MRVRVRKWGNSLAVRIPKAFAADTKFGDGSAVEMRLVKGSVVLKPVAAPKYTLAGLLAGVTSRNLHGEFETGAAVGRELG